MTKLELWQISIYEKKKNFKKGLLVGTFWHLNNQWDAAFCYSCIFYFIFFFIWIWSNIWYWNHWMDSILKKLTSQVFLSLCFEVIKLKPALYHFKGHGINWLARYQILFLSLSRNLSCTDKKKLRLMLNGEEPFYVASRNYTLSWVWK